MKKRNISIFIGVMIVLLALLACSRIMIQKEQSAQAAQSVGTIYLYGEAHGVDKILDKEFELWQEYYNDQNMRHLFIELPYYTAEFLNVWMKSDSNEILDALYNDWRGTQAYNMDSKKFYEKIKKQCPETIFHGTDVGHQSDTTGKRFLEYLQNNGLEESEQYLRTKETIKQGEYFYGHSDDKYRENKMVDNFIREFDKLNGENIMGIYGSAHTGLKAKNFTKSVPCMANQLKKHYGNNIYSEDLSGLAKAIDPKRVDTIKIGEKDYKASYFGKDDLKGFKDYSYREFWRLENAYEDFSDRPKTKEVLPHDNYPMQIEKGQIFVIDYTKIDGSVIRKYYRDDGKMWNDMPSTVEFKID